VHTIKQNVANKFLRKAPGFLSNKYEETEDLDG